MNIKDFAEKFIKAEDEAFIRGNFDALEKVEDRNVVYHLMAINQELTGYDSDKQFILSMRKALPDMQIEWKYLTGEGNIFALSFKMKATYKEQMPGLPPPTGKEVTAHTLMLFRLSKGKVVEAWSNGTITGLT
jgi:predicted ester cyclase